MTADLERLLRDVGPVDADAAQERFVRRAVDDGLADVAYAPVDSPVGELMAAVTRRGLVRLAYEDGRGDAAPGSTCSAGTGARLRARWASIALRLAIFSSQPRRLSARFRRG